MPREMVTIASVANTLRERIQSGLYGQQGRLPAVVDLSKEFRTSRDTINRALKQLQAEGYLESKGLGRRGVIPSRSRVRIQGITARFDMELQRVGMTPFEENIEVPVILPATSEIAAALDIREGEPVVRRFRRQGVRQEDDHIPYRLVESFYPTSLIDEPLLSQMRQDDRYDVILAIKERHHKAIIRVHEDIISRFPTDEEYHLLNITYQTPVLELNRVNYAEDSTVIMFNKIILVANYFMLSYDYPVSHWNS